MIGRFASRIANDRSGVTIIEFAILAPVLLMMLLGFFELGHREFVQAVLQGEIEDAGRRSGIQSGLDRLGDIDAAVETAVRPLVGRNATFTSTRVGYTNFADIGTPEQFVDKAPKNNMYDPNECFTDANGNGKWDADRGRAGQGLAQDVVVYQITVAYARLFPLDKILGWSKTQSTSGSTVLRNQPYAQQRIEAQQICP